VAEDLSEEHDLVDQRRELASALATKLRTILAERGALLPIDRRTGEPFVIGGAD